MVWIRIGCKRFVLMNPSYSHSNILWIYFICICIRKKTLNLLNNIRPWTFRQSCFPEQSLGFHPFHSETWTLLATSGAVLIMWPTQPTGKTWSQCCLLLWHLDIVIMTFKATLVVCKVGEHFLSAFQFTIIWNWQENSMRLLKKT